MYPSEWLKFDVLVDGDQTLTIASLSETTFKDQKTGAEKDQIVLHFTETELKLGLGIGNARTLAKLFGDDPDEWAGKKIVVGCATANNGTDYVQVREKPTQSANRARKTPSKPVDALPGAMAMRASSKVEPVTQAELDAASEDDDIPF